MKEIKFELEYSDEFKSSLSKPELGLIVTNSLNESHQQWRENPRF